jgi:hypothetical protein
VKLVVVTASFVTEPVEVKVLVASVVVTPADEVTEIVTVPVPAVPSVLM